MHVFVVCILVRVCAEIFRDGEGGGVFVQYPCWDMLVFHTCLS